MASTSASQPSQLSGPLRVVRCDFSIKTANSESWVRLESPTGDKRHNCYGVAFDGGITVKQWNKATGGTCDVKFIVESPPTITLGPARDQQLAWYVEAKCLEIGEPEFGTKHAAIGIENAKTFPLASLDKATQFIKLEVTQSNLKPKNLGDEEVRHRITVLTARKAQEPAALDAGVHPAVSQQQTLSLQPQTLPPPPADPSSPSADPFPPSTLPRTRSFACSAGAAR